MKSHKLNGWHRLFVIVAIASKMFRRFRWQFWWHLDWQIWANLGYVCHLEFSASR